MQWRCITFRFDDVCLHMYTVMAGSSYRRSYDKCDFLCLLIAYLNIKYKYSEERCTKLLVCFVSNEISKKGKDLSMIKRKLRIFSINIICKIAPHNVMKAAYTPWPNKNASIMFEIIFQKLMNKNEKLFHNNNK